MNYSEFIYELRQLLAEAQALFNENETHESPKFRKWRHQLTTTISIIEDRGYRIDCDVASRIFQVATYDPVSKTEQIKRYNQELQDTINEIEIIIKHFNKYGDPKESHDAEPSKDKKIKRKYSMADSEIKLSELRKEIHKEANAQAAKGLVAGAVVLAIVAASGWWLYLKPKIVQLAGGVPSGAVVAFDTPSNCPDDWVPFDDASGRVLVGTGKGKELTERKYREEGGEEAHILTLAELAKHTHSTTQMIGNNAIDGVDSTVTHSGEHHNERRETDPTGNGSAHNNMQPYIVLKMCKKQ